MRKEISVLGGIREWNETRERWLSRIPKVVRRVLGTENETISYRTVRSLWYGEIKDSEHYAARDIRRAAELLQARKDALALTEQYQKLIGGLLATDQNTYSADIDRLERVARLLCGGDRS